MTLLPHVRRLLLRDLDGLERQVRLYPDDASPWSAVPGLPNAGGTLVLHLAGNLRHFVGGQLGGTGYVRDREREFSARGLGREVLRDHVAAARKDVDSTLGRLDPAVLETEYPVAFSGKRLPTDLFLLHLSSHLAYHLGQVDYHRRAVTGDGASAGAVSISALLP